MFDDFNMLRQSRCAFVFNMGVWYNIAVGPAMVRMKKRKFFQTQLLNEKAPEQIRYEDDPPAHLYKALLGTFQAAYAVQRKANHSAATGSMFFYRETAAQHWPQFEVDTSTNESCKDGAQLPCPSLVFPCAEFPNFSVGGEFPNVCSTRKRGENTRCIRNASLKYNKDVPYKWRDRIAMQAARDAEFDVIVPPVRTQSYQLVLRQVNRQQTLPDLLWLPFYEASRRKGESYPTINDCTHPTVDPFLWEVMWDGMARCRLPRTTTPLPRDHAPNGTAKTILTVEHPQCSCSLAQENLDLRIH